MCLYKFRAHARWFIAHVLRDELTEAEQLLKKREYIVSDRNRTGETPLHWLAIENELAGVELLLRYGADPCFEDKYGDCILSSAAMLGLTDVAKALMDGGADVHWRHSFNKETVLHAAARHSPEPAMIDLLLDAGLEIEVEDEWGETPLEQALQLDNVRSVERLLERGAVAQADAYHIDSFVAALPEEEREKWKRILTPKE